MNPMRPLLLAACLAVPVGAFAAPTPYAIDPNHTQVFFTYSHNGMAHITGRFGEVAGTFAFDAADPAASNIAVTIPVESLSTGVPRLDEHMKSPDMFDAAKYPTATFTSTKVTVAGPGRFQVAGNLTIHGVTRPATLDVVANHVGPHPRSKAPSAGFDATTTIKRSDFGIGYALPNVGDEVSIRITMEAAADKP